MRTAKAVHAINDAKMTVTNLTTGSVVATKVGLARKLTERMKGLLGRSRLDPGEGLIIKPCSAIHTFGMRFPIDVVFFDGEGRVISAIRGMKPCRMSMWRPGAKGVLELPVGALEASPARAGDMLEFR